MPRATHDSQDALGPAQGMRSRRAPITPSSAGGPTVPTTPPLPPGPATSPKAARAGSALDTVGAAAEEAVRRAPQSPTAAAFGAAQRIVSSGRSAIQGARRRTAGSAG